MMNRHNSANYAVEKTLYPTYSAFSNACHNGLSVIYPFKMRAFDDPYGWKFGARYPPSYWAHGRMYTLLVVQEALGLKPRRVLEVGAGGGGLAATLAAKGCEVTVNDLRERELAAALEEYFYAEKIRLVGGDMFDLSAEQLGTFDLVIACEVIEHVAHPLDLLRHLKSFLHPEGRILLTTPNGMHFRNRLPTFSEVQDFNELEARQFMPDADGHLFLFTPQELCDSATAVGLTVERLRVWGTPILSGHFGFRLLASRFLIRTAYQTELLVQRLPLSVRAHLCVAISAVFAAENEKTRGSSMCIRKSFREDSVDSA